MNQFRILPPDKARQKARSKVREFKLEKAKRALEEKHAKKHGPKMRAEPEGVLFIFHIGGNRQIKDGVVLKLADIKDGKADLDVLGHGPHGIHTTHYPGYGEGTGFKYVGFSVFVKKIDSGEKKVSVVLSDTAESSVKLSPEKQEEMNKNFMRAVREGKRGINEVNRLLEDGAEVNAVDGEGWSALMWATAAQGDMEIARMLVDAGADVNILDVAGWSVLDVAITHNTTELEKFLKSKGAKRGDELP